MAEGVVATALVLVAQRGVGFVDLFEFLLGGLLLLLAGLGVGMVLPCEPSVGFLNLLLAGVPVDAEDLVIVSFHHRGDGDRKSTRLNSSHVRISYAVFCLSKNSRPHCPRLPPD